MEQVPDDDIPPHLWVQMQEEMARRIERLDRPEYAKFRLQTIAILKLEGHSNARIAEHLGCVVRTVERRLKMIRAIWSESDGSGAARVSS
jgi:DNA-directed RNA polymerase specialized sigma24 family protein